MKLRPHIEVRGKCPYCDYAWSVELRDVRGKLFALRCIDCREIVVVDVAVEVKATVHAVAGVESGAVMDRLIAEKLPREPGVLISGASEEAEKINTADDDELDEPPGKAQHSPPPKRQGNYRRKLSYDDRTRIRTRYQDALEAQQAKGLTKLPRGFVQALAAEFGVSDQTVITIGRNTDSFDGDAA